MYPTEPLVKISVDFIVGEKIPASKTSNSFSVDQIFILSPFLILPSKTFIYVITPL
jgi:hypothetical protein